MQVVFTDLDGTLLDHISYRWDAARPALQALEERAIPLVICTSKTRSEVEVLRAEWGNRHPFIVENGGAAFVPEGYFGDAASEVRREGYEVLEFGASYTRLVEALAKFAAGSGCRVRGFHDMPVPEVAELCEFSMAEAERAKVREYGEPFVIETPERTEALIAAIEAGGFRYTEGGRFHHLTGGNDKGGAVRRLVDLFRQTAGEVHSIGLGDGPNDAEFLLAVDTPILIPSPKLEQLSGVLPGARVAAAPGPEGWNLAVLNLINPSPNW